MKKPARSRCGPRGNAALLLALALLSSPLFARTAHRPRTSSNSQFATAQHLQETLEGQPVAGRTRRDYERVINAYRRVYLESPASAKADPSVMAAAQMTEEMGRRFDDDAILRSAIQQYEFLRRQYPGSKSRFVALFRIAEIYKDDLHETARGNAAFEEFLHRYPRNPFAEQARKELAEPVQPAAVKSAGLKSNVPRPKAASPAKESDDSNATSSDDDNLPEQSAAAPQPSDEKPNRVTGIRHWSTPDYTRVVIDLEGKVKFESQQIANPDRVFFDLLGTRLEPKLVGKSFDVDDGFLKKIRVSQFNPGRTRVVLETDEFTDFIASLMPNPPRLVIDILNKQTARNKTSGTAIAKAGAAAFAGIPKPDPNQSDAADAPDTSVAGLTSDSTDEEEPAAPAADKPSRRTTVVTSNGIKKTIVDADDNAPAPHATTAKDKDAAGKDPITNDLVAKNTVTRPDLPEIKPTPKASETATSSDSGKSRSAKGKRKTAPADPDAGTREAQPTASGDRSLIRALGLKIGKIVIDPGHGGHDTGTIGPAGLEEKDLVLEVSRRLGKLLQARLGAQVVYTRSDDTFIPLETRTAIANQEGADLFVSVHANSSHDPDARGVETYYLNFSSSPDALEVAARENAVSENSIHELQDLVKKIALKEKIDESREFATDVESALHSGLAAKSPGIRDRGVKKAPFIVLIGANMPSILAEISFVSNPVDERKLKTSDYRQRIAESLYQGIAKYVSGLSGVKVASKLDKSEGQ